MERLDLHSINRQLANAVSPCWLALFAIKDHADDHLTIFHIAMLHRIQRVEKNGILAGADGMGFCREGPFSGPKSGGRAKQVY